MKSIIQEEKECYICKNFKYTKLDYSTYGIEEHHIFHGTANRKLSEKYGLKVNLCTEHHRTGKYAVHKNRNTDIMLKQIGQKEYMKHYNKTEDEFIKIFGKSYI